MRTFVGGRAKRKLAKFPLSKSRTWAHCSDRNYQHRPEVCWLIISIIIPFGTSAWPSQKINEQWWCLITGKSGSNNYSYYSICNPLTRANLIIHIWYATLHLESTFCTSSLRSSALISFQLSGTAVYFHLHAQAITVALALNLIISKGLLHWWYCVDRTR